MTSRRPDALERLPVELDAVARPIRREREAGVDPEWLGDELFIMRLYRADHQSATGTPLPETSVRILKGLAPHFRDRHRHIDFQKALRFAEISRPFAVIPAL